MGELSDLLPINMNLNLYLLAANMQVPIKIFNEIESTPGHISIIRMVAEPALQQIKTASFLHQANEINLKHCSASNGENPDHIHIFCLYLQAIMWALIEIRYVTRSSRTTRWGQSRSFDENTADHQLARREKSFTSSITGPHKELISSLLM